MAQKINTTESNNKGLKMTIAVLSLVIFLMAGIGIGGYVFADSSEESFISQIMPEAEASENSISLEEFLINLSNENSRSQPIVRLEMTITSTADDADELIENDIAKVRDAVIHVVSTKNADSLYEETDGEFVIKDEIKEKINETLGNDIIEEVYLTNILMQR